MLPYGYNGKSTQAGNMPLPMWTQGAEMHSEREWEAEGSQDPDWPYETGGRRPRIQSARTDRGIGRDGTGHTCWTAVYLTVYE